MLNYTIPVWLALIITAILISLAMRLYVIRSYWSSKKIMKEKSRCRTIFNTKFNIVMKGSDRNRQKED